jgi:hypothetical protein
VQVFWGCTRQWVTYQQGQQQNKVTGIAPSCSQPLQQGHQQQKQQQQQQQPGELGYIQSFVKISACFIVAGTTHFSFTDLLQYHIFALVKLHTHTSQQGRLELSMLEHPYNCTLLHPAHPAANTSRNTLLKTIGCHSNCIKQIPCCCC